MKSFLIKIISAALVVCFIIVLLNGAFIKLQHFDAEKTNKFNDVPTGIMVCNFGSSHGMYGFCYDNTKLPSFNFALASQSPLYDSRILEYYKSNISEGAVVFIPISYFSVYGIDETLTAGFDSKNQRYYNFLPKNLITNYDGKVMFLKRLPILTAYEELARVFANKTAAEDDGWDSQTLEDISVEASAYTAAMSHVESEKLDESGKRILNETNLSAIYKMVEICNEIGATPILLTTPYSSEYKEMVETIAPGFFEEFKALTDKISSDTGAQYYDYSEWNNKNGELFMNADHLNRRGASEFTDMLVAEYLKK